MLVRNKNVKIDIDEEAFLLAAGLRTPLWGVAF
jgi:hypothetical protein